MLAGVLELLDSNLQDSSSRVQSTEELPPGFPCLMSVGEYESAEFKRQGEEFHKVCCIIDQPDIMFDITVVVWF